MPLFHKKPKRLQPLPDPFSSWQDQLSTKEQPPLPQKLMREITRGLQQSKSRSVFAPALVVGLASAGAQILRAINNRILDDNRINPEKLTHLIIGEKGDFDLVKTESIYTELLTPQITPENYRQAYAKCFQDANNRKRLLNSLHNRFGDAETEFKTFIVGSLREAAAAAISDFVTIIKAEFPNTEIISFLSFEMMDDIDLVRDGEMIAQLRELSRMTYKTFHFSNRLNHLPNASREIVCEDPKVLIDQIFLFDARNISRRDENFKFDSVQEIAEGLFNYLSPCSKRIFEKFSNVRTQTNRLREELSEPLFSSLTAKALVYPLKYITELSVSQILNEILVGNVHSLFSDKLESEHADKFVRKFISHELQHRDLFFWMMNKVKRLSDMKSIPKLDSIIAVRSFRYILLDVTNQFLNRNEEGQNLATLSDGVKNIRTLLENTYRIGLQNKYADENASRWESLEKFLVESKKVCSQLLKNIKSWNEVIFGKEDDLVALDLINGETVRTVSKQLNNHYLLNKEKIRDNLLPRKITRFSLNDEEVIEISGELTKNILSKVGEYLVWNASLTIENELQLGIIIKNASTQYDFSEFTHDQVELFIQKLRELIEELISQETLTPDVKFQGENQDFVAEISTRSGLAFDQNHDMMNLIRSLVNDELLEFTYSFYDGNKVDLKPLSDVAEEIFGGAYTTSQKETISHGCHNRLSVLKIDNIIPYQSIQTTRKLSRDYKYRYHLLPQEWNSKILENEIHEFQSLNNLDFNYQFRVVPQIQACLWSPVLFDLFFFILINGAMLLTQIDSGLGDFGWQIDAFGDFERLVICETGSLLHALKNFTLILPAKYREGDKFHPFCYHQRIKYFRDIYDICQDNPNPDVSDVQKYVQTLSKGNEEEKCLGDILEFMVWKIFQSNRIFLEINEPLFKLRTV